MKKMLALLLAAAMAMAAIGTVAGAPASFTEAPYITNLGTYGSVTDRLPVAEDIMVETTSSSAIRTVLLQG